MMKFNGGVKGGGGGGVGMDVVGDVLLVESVLFGDDGVDGVNDYDVEGEEWGELMYKDGEVVSWNDEGKIFVDEVKIGCGDVEGNQGEHKVWLWLQTCLMCVDVQRLDSL
ncbi:hypothetical protein Tco_0723528 [Tanacetum coccineum]